MLEMKDLSFLLTITLCFKHVGYFLKTGVNLSFCGHPLYHVNGLLQVVHFLGSRSPWATQDRALFPCGLSCSP